MNIFAETKTIELEKVMANYYNSLSGVFAINSELGRAWVEVIGHYSDPDSLDDVTRVKVEGLSYNQATKQIIFTENGSEVVCANIKITRVFKDEVIKPTGACRFEARTIKVKVDDGFEIKTKAYDILDLKIEL